MNVFSQAVEINKDKISLDNEAVSYREMANCIRALSMDAVERAKSGHPGMPMGMADVATILFNKFLKFDPLNANWPDRDRFVLSAGHGSMLLYSLLYLSGYPDITMDDIKNFRQLHAKTAGHPEYGFLEGIETTTGPLGQGLANAVGMAIAERILAAKFNDLVNHKTYVIVGDGCLMEGISQEAISLAGHLNLNNLIVLFDDNSITIDGPTSLSTSENHLERFRACNWEASSIDGHDFAQIEHAIEKAIKSSKPCFIACKTTIAYGAPTKAGSENSHGSPLGAKEIEGAKAILGWEAAEFEVPDDLLKSWRQVGKKNAALYQDWLKKLNSSNVKDEFLRLMDRELPKGWEVPLLALKKQVIDDNITEATRKSSGRILNTLNETIPEMIGGSADLTGSNDTKTKSHFGITKEDFSGRYIYYGIREHAMAAIMNGMALHKGIIPYGGTFLVFSDYCRPAIRLSALMQQRVIYVMTHDSIGLGEDGPTHQPVEHIASLRAIPNLLVFRPADVVETIECWQLALTHQDAPSLLALTRQNVPLLRTSYNAKNSCAAGGYIISEANLTLKVTIFATGSEVQIAYGAQQELERNNIGTRVISMPCWELFEQQPLEYQDSLLNNNSLKVAIEALGKMGWERYIGRDGIFIGMEGFGASAKAEDLYSHFGITKEHAVKQILSKLRV
jgi:transketolase